MLELNDDKDGRKTLFVDVVLPLAISKTYTYRIPQALNDQIAVGKRVVVQFGKSRIYTAIVAAVKDEPPKLYEAKYIIDVLDDEPVVNLLQLQLWEWIAGYYMCTMGEVMQAALPSALKLASETKVILIPEAVFSKDDLSDKEFLVIEALEIQPEIKVSDITKLLGQKSVFKLLKSLFDKGIIHISEELSERYKPRKKTFITLNPFYNEGESRRALFEALEKRPKQMDALLTFLRLSRTETAVSKKDILEHSGCGQSALKSLIDKEVFIAEQRIVSRLSYSTDVLQKDFVLSQEQQEALQSIQIQFKEKDVVLLHGVTSSGKTQIYIRIIEEVLAGGRQVLYLLPEIALTTQVIERLREYFGDDIGVYHSRLGDNERAEVWRKVLSNEYKVVLGARSSVFLPFASLGLIVIDEEHETTYKQQDPAPRYHARDTAIYMAHLHEAKVLLGSATPSLESFFNSKTGKYGFAELKHRFGESVLPDIKVVSITEELNKKTIQSHFTSVLVEEINKALERKEQVILFQNRRGYTPVSVCRTCGFIPKCLHCDVSLTYHKSTGQQHCHYCGYKQDPISVCPACGSTHIEQKGFGTEKVEDELQYIFPDARIGRLDLDTTRSKNSFQRILSDFEERKIDILVGTQIVAKGLDFDHVTLIGIINADSLFNYPDFRAFEKSYQLLSQVSGRAGRREKPGTVIIQAYNTTHRVIGQVINHDYSSLFSTELAERKHFQYPPLYRLIRMEIKHKDPAVLGPSAQRFAAMLKASLSNRVLGPEDPLVGRIRNFYIKSIYVKIERNGISVAKVKDFIRASITQFETDKKNKGVIIQIDIDPY